MKRASIFLVSILVLALPVLLLSAPQGKGDVAAGKAVYTRSCASCHGPEGEGKPAIAKVMKVELRHLGSKEVQDKTDEQLLKESVDGIGKMKPVKVTEKDKADLLAFLRSLKK